jgi:hypothetical protein
VEHPNFFSHCVKQHPILPTDLMNEHELIDDVLELTILTEFLLEEILTCQKRSLPFLVRQSRSESP